nr:receptor-type guanylate cyclase gcy-29-like [Lytechinus pictus]
MAGRDVLSIYYFIMEILAISTSMTLSSSLSPSSSITFGIILTSDDNMFGAPQMLPAFDIALLKITTYIDVVIGPLNYVLRKTVDSCDHGTIVIAPAEAAELYLYDNVIAFFGPSCSEETSEVADLASYWQVPVLSAVAIDVKLDEKARFRTLTRTSFVASQFGQATLEVLQRFQWTHVAVLYSDDIIFREIIVGLITRLDAYNITYVLSLVEECVKIEDIFQKFRGMYHVLSLH